MAVDEDWQAMKGHLLVLRAEIEDLRTAWDRHEKALGDILVARSLEAARRVAASRMIEERRISVVAFRKRMLIQAGRDNDRTG